MIQRAGIALGRLAYDSEFSISQVNHDPDTTFLPPTRHKLIDGHTVDDIVNIFHDIVGFDARLDSNGFTVSLPIMASQQQSKAFEEAIGDRRRVSNHFEAWLAAYTKNAPDSEEDVHFIFIDLTPGQITSIVVMNGRILNQRLISGLNSIRIRLSGCIDSSNTEDLYDKLVGSIVPGETNLDLVCILRPKGAFPDLSNTGLESKFSGITVKWVTLDDISHGGAVLMDREPVTSSTTMLPSSRGPGTRIPPIGITLADGNCITVLPDYGALPYKRTFMFTTSRDNQTIVTVRLCRGTKHCAEVTLNGLTPKPRGQAVIKVILDTSRVMNMSVSIEEIGTSLKITNALGMVLQLYTPNMDVIETSEESTGEQVEMTLGKDGIIGELPE
jgi:hypothetical protein